MSCVIARCSAREHSPQHDESCPGELRGRVEIHEAEPLAERDVIVRRERERRRAFPNAAARRSRPSPRRRAPTRRAGSAAPRGSRRAPSRRREARFAGRERIAELADLAHQRLDVAAGRFRATDALRALVARLAQALDLDLQLFALRFERDVARAVEHETAAREIRDHESRSWRRAL